MAGGKGGGVGTFDFQNGFCEAPSSKTIIFCINAFFSFRSGCMIFRLRISVAVQNNHPVTTVRALGITFHLFFLESLHIGAIRWLCYS